MRPHTAGQRADFVTRLFPESPAPPRRRTFSPLVAALAAACALGLGGCASKSYTVKVDANTIGEPQISGTFRLVAKPSSPFGQATMPQALEIARRALKHKGLTEAAATATPDLTVSVDCGLATGVIRHEITSVPVFVMVPGRVRTETQQVGTGVGGTPIMQTVTIQDPPTQELAGYRERTFEVQNVKKFLRLIAARKNPDAAESGQLPAWGVQAYYESEDSDLKGALPVLAAASMTFVGQVTRDRASIAMKDSDPDVSALRSGR